MNSETAVSKREAIFGSKSPLKGIQNERGLDGSFRNFFATNASQNYRERIFAGYREFLNLTGLNRTYIDQVVRTLIAPFVAYNYTEAMDKLEKLKTEFDLDVARNIVRENLKKLFNTSSISVVIDRGEYIAEKTSNKPGLRFAFDYVRSSPTSDLLDPLDFTWSNGVIEFKAKTEVAVGFFVPYAYMAQVIKESFNTVAQEAQVNVISAVPSTVFAKAREIISNDIIISIIQNIYSDRAREFVIARSRALFLVSEIYLGTLSSVPDRESDQSEWEAFYKKMNEAGDGILSAKFKIDSGDYKAAPDLGYFLSKTYGNEVDVHPLTLYTYLFNVTDLEANGLIARMSTVVDIGKIENYDRDNVVTRPYLEHNFSDDTADILALAIDVTRVLPIVLLSVFFFGRGKKYGYYQRFASVIKDFSKSLRMDANWGMNTRSFTRYADVIDDYIKFGEGSLSNARLDEVVYNIVNRAIDLGRNGIEAAQTPDSPA